MEEKLYFVFDVESIGLHGEAYAYGYVVVDERGAEIEAGSAACDPDRASGFSSDRAWVAANCPPLTITHNSPGDVQCEFYESWLRWKDRAVMVADCPWPVEAKFLLACHRLYGFGVYPLIDVASVVLAAGGDPTATFDRHENELPKHDPLADARQSARVFIEHLGDIADDRAAAKRLLAIENAGRV
jgi:hypothetical protein